MCACMWTFQSLSHTHTHTEHKHVDRHVGMWYVFLCVWKDQKQINTGCLLLILSPLIFETGSHSLSLELPDSATPGILLSQPSQHWTTAPPSFFYLGTRNSESCFHSKNLPAPSHHMPETFHSRQTFPCSIVIGPHSHFLCPALLSYQQGQGKGKENNQRKGTELFISCCSLILYYCGVGD